MSQTTKLNSQGGKTVSHSASKRRTRQIIPVCGLISSDVQPFALVFIMHLGGNTRVVFERG